MSLSSNAPAETHNHDPVNRANVGDLITITARRESNLISALKRVDS